MERYSLELPEVGSTASRSASPTRLTANSSTISTIAGKMNIHGRVVADGVPSASSNPSETSGRWTPKPTNVKYQWYAKGKAIKGATRRKFTPTLKQLGKRLSVKVTAKAIGYAPATVTTPRTGKIKD